MLISILKSFPKLRGLLVFFCLCFPLLGQSLLRNGYIERDGLITFGDTDEWVFDANAGDYVSIRMAVDETTYVHRAAIVVDYQGSVIYSSRDRNDFATSFTAPHTGRYHIEIGDVVGAPLLGRFEYIISLARSGAAYQVNQGDEGGALINGDTRTGAVTRGDIDMFDFPATAGRLVQIGIGELSQTGSFSPRIRIFNPLGVQVGSDSGGSAAGLEFTPSVTGDYTVIVENASSDVAAVGFYQLFFSTVGDFIVPSGDQGGPLTNGGNHAGTITIADLDMWSFEANQGDRIELAVGELSGDIFEPTLLVIGPTGLVVASAAGFTATEVGFAAPASGRYTVIVDDSDTNDNDGIGTYQLFFARMPGDFNVPSGDEGGPLTNGGNHTGTITIADLDMWSFEANQGERVELAVGELSGDTFEPTLLVIGPTGLVVASAAGFTATEVGFAAPASGRYTVIVDDSDTNDNDGIGTYQLFFARMPGDFIVPSGDQGGPLTNGGNHAGTVTIADLDMWSFEANQGDRIELAVGELSGDTFEPTLLVIGPTGLVVASAAGFTATEVGFAAPASGRYTVLVDDSDTNDNDGIGTYQLFFARMPGDFIVPSGDQGGPLTSGGVHPGIITVADMDMWSFAALSGDTITLTATETAGSASGFGPGLYAVAPNGTVVASHFSGSSSGTLFFNAPLAGRYTVIVEDNSASSASTGNYQLSYLRIPAIADYTAHAAANGISGPNSAFSDDFNKDGIPNGLAYGLGLTLTNSTQPAALPQVQMTSDGPALRVKLPEPTPTGLNYTIQFKHGLNEGTWRTLATLPTGASHWVLEPNAFIKTDEVDRVSVLIGLRSSAFEGATSIFLRLAVSESAE